MAGRAQITVQQLRGGIQQLAHGFDDLARAVQPAATNSQQLATAFKDLNSVLEDIKKFSAELNTTIASLTSKGGKGKVKDTLFTAFTDVMDAVNKTVDDSKINEFQARAKSMRNFVLSLKDMATLNGKVDEINGLLSKLNTPATKGGKNTPIQAIVDIINTLGSVSERTQLQTSDKNGAPSLKNIINPKIQGIRDVINLIASITPELKELTAQKVEKGRQELLTIKNSLKNFIETLGGLAGRVESETTTTNSKDNTSTKKPIQLINNQIAGIRDLAKVVETLGSNLNELVNKDISGSVERLEDIQEPLINLINKVGNLIPSSSVTNFDKNGHSKTVQLINAKVHGLQGIGKAIKGLASGLSEMGADVIGTAIWNVDQVKGPLFNLISSVDSLGADTASVTANDPNNTSAKIVTKLSVTLGGLRNISKSIKVLSDNLKEMEGTTIEGAINNLNKVKDPLINLISAVDGLGADVASKTANTTNNQNGKLISKLTVILRGVRDIARTIKLLAEDLKGMGENAIAEAASNLDKVKDPLANLIKDVGSLGTRFQGTNAAGKPILQLNANIQGIRDIARTIKLLADDLKGLEQASSVISNLGSIKDDIVSFITGFNIPAGTNKDNFDNGIANLDSISKVMKKYAKIVVDLNNVGSANVVDLARKFKTFIEEISKAVNNRKLTNINTDNVKNLGKVAQGFKTVFNLLSSVSSGKFANFTTEIDKAIPNLETFIDRMATLSKRSTFPDFERVANAVGKFNVKMKDISSVVNQANSAMTGFKRTLGQVFVAIFGFNFIHATIRTIKNAINEIFNLEYAMARVNTIARVSSNELKNMTRFVQEVSATYGIASSKVAKALYDINSATIKGSASLKILEQSAKLAVAGFTDIDKVTNLIARAVNAYEYSASEASKVSDILFVTVERGINPMEELSEYMGRLFTVSANAGVSLEEVGAGLATLTARGYQTNVASTALNSAILKLSTGTKELNKLFQQYGYASSASALRTMGLTGALQVLYQATNGATEKLHDLGFNYRDIRAATTLASSAIDEYNKTLALMNDETYKSGLTNEALAKVQDTVKFRIEQLKEAYTVCIQTLADYIDKNQILKEAIKLLNTGISDLTKSMQGLSLSVGEMGGAAFVKIIPKLISTYAIIKLFHPSLSKTSSIVSRMFVVLPRVLGGSRLALKGLGVGIASINAGLKAMFTHVGSLHLLFIKLQGTIEIISRLFTVFSSGTFWSGLGDSDVLSNLFKGDLVGAFIKTPLANLAGVIGSVIDTFTGFSTDFGGMWRNAIKPADFQDKNATYRSEEYRALLDVWYKNRGLSSDELRSILKEYAYSSNISEDVLKEALKNLSKVDIRKVASDAISSLKKIQISGTDDTNALQSEYENWRSKIQQMADDAGFSADEFKEMMKQVDKVRDSLLGLNSEFLDLQPNLKALNDVFEISKKEIEKNYDKNAGPLQKASKVISDVQNAMNVLSEGFNTSAEQVAVWFANPSNFAEFDAMIHGGIKDFANRINKILQNVIEKEDFEIPELKLEDALESSNYKNIIQKIWKEEVLNKGVRFVQEGLLPKDVTSLLSGNTDIFSATNLSDKEREEYASNVIRRLQSEVVGKIGFENKLLKNTKIKEHFATIVNTLQSSGAFSEEDINKLKNSETLFKKFREQYAQISKNPLLLVNAIGDAISDITPEMRSAIQTVATGIAEANKESINFVKQMVSFSSTMSKLSSEFKIEDIIGNKLKLSEVDYFKKQMLQSLGITEDNGFFDAMFSGIAEDMRQKMSAEKIKEKWMQAVKFLNPALDDVSAQNIIGSLFDPITNMVKSYDDFNKQFNKLDYLKHINKLKYGGEMSTFNKYKEVGSKIIEDLKASTVTTNIGDVAFEELYSDFNSALESGVGFEELKVKFSEKYGADAFIEFYNKFKEFDGYVKEFITEINELDFMKFVNRIKFGNELSAFKQFKEVDSKKIADIMGRTLVDGVNFTFKEAFDYAVKYGNDALEQMLTGTYGDIGKAIYNQYKNTEKEYEDVMKGSPFALQTQYKGIKKQIRDFIRNYEDAFLSPLQQFNKTEDKLKRQLAKVRKQAKEGIVDPDAVSELIKTAENLQKLNEETMNLKVPAAITASEAVRTGSKEAFDLVARNVFKDTYKVNVRQANYQKEIVKIMKDMSKNIGKSEQIAVTYP